MATRIPTTLEEQNLLSATQEGCHLGSIFCEYNLIISKTIFED
jgi:hypothetical protein